MSPRAHRKTTAPNPTRRKAEPNDMPRLRAEILAAFCVPEPTNAHDLRDRAVMVGAVARWLSGLDDDSKAWAPADFERYSAKYAEVAAECERMLADGLMLQPHPDLMDHHKPPRDTYSLTALGATQAMAVLATSKEAAR